MHLAESAAWAIVLAAREGVAPADVDISVLQRHLVEQGIMISFFNDVDMASAEPWLPAVQFLAARGFFGDYDAAPLAPVDAMTASKWHSLAPHVPLAQLVGLNRAQAAAIIFHSLPWADATKRQLRSNMTLTPATAKDL